MYNNNKSCINHTTTGTQRDKRKDELYAAYTAEKALLVPELVRGELHEVAILNLLSTSFTYFLRLFALDCTDDVCKTKDSHWRSVNHRSFTIVQ